MRTLKSALLVGLGCLLFAGAAFATINTGDRAGRWILGGLQVGTNATIGTASNLTTRMLAPVGQVIDFASATITSVDSSAITVTGAQVGDPCFVGAPTTIAANTSFTCYVSAADTVKIRYGPMGTAADPPSGTYFVRVISNQ